MISNFRIKSMLMCTFLSSCVRVRQDVSGEGVGCLVVTRCWVDSEVYCSRLTIRLHTAPCRLCRSGVSLTWSGVAMAVPIRSHCEELEKPSPAKHKYKALATELLSIIHFFATVFFLTSRNITHRKQKN